MIMIIIMIIMNTTHKRSLGKSLGRFVLQAAIRETNALRHDYWQYRILSCDIRQYVQPKNTIRDDTQRDLSYTDTQI
jgi:hypothetical protein